VSRSLLKEWVRLCVIPLCKAYRVTVLSVDTCPSQRKGYHVYIHIAPPVRAELAWRLQLYLGDDARRCSLNRARLKAGFDEWNKLFEGIRPRFSTIYTGRNQETRRIHDILTVK
jgi:hypothetical protein